MFSEPIRRKLRRTVWVSIFSDVIAIQTAGDSVLCFDVASVCRKRGEKETGHVGKFPHFVASDVVARTRRAFPAADGARDDATLWKTSVLDNFRVKFAPRHRAVFWRDELKRRFEAG